MAKHTYQYDDKDQLVKKFRYTGMDTVPEVTQYYVNRRSIYYYSTKNTKFSKDGEKFVYQLNRNSKLDSTINYDENGIPIYSTGYEYYKNGLLKSKISIDDEQQINTVYYKYDNFSNQISRNIIRGEGYDTLFHREFTFNFKYDERGNILRQEEIVNGKLTSITMNEIQYR